jgi:uncharacterized protein (DUF1778 family)
MTKPRDTAAMAGKDRQLQIRVSVAEKAAIQRAARRAGMDLSAWALRRLLPSAQRTFRDLTDTLAREPSRRRFTLADLNDFLADLRAEAFLDAVAEPPAEGLDPYTANYVAAMVETAAHRSDVPPPAWTLAVQPLSQPMFGSPLLGLRLHLLLAAPPAFKRRNIFVDSSIGDRV